MMYPILCKVSYESLHLALRQKSLWRQIGFSVLVNWLVAPFVMVRLLPHRLSQHVARAHRPSLPSLRLFFPTSRTCGAASSS